MFKFSQLAIVGRLEEATTKKSTNGTTLHIAATIPLEAFKVVVGPRDLVTKIKAVPALHAVPTMKYPAEFWKARHRKTVLVRGRITARYRRKISEIIDID